MAPSAIQEESKSRDIKHIINDTEWISEMASLYNRILTSLEINQGLDLMLSNEYNSICSVYEEHWVPRWTESMAPYNWDINNRPRRQDMPKLFVENGAFYITKKEDLLNCKLRYSGKIGYVQMKQESSFQIDTLDDLELIKKLL